MSNNEKRFKNLKNIPDVDGIVSPRMSLKVDSKNVPVSRYWKRRMAEGAIEPMDKPVPKADASADAETKSKTTKQNEGK